MADYNSRKIKYKSFIFGEDDTSILGAKKRVGTLAKAYNVDLIDDSLCVTRRGYLPYSASNWGTRRIRQGYDYVNSNGNHEILVYGDDGTATGGILGRWKTTTAAPVTISSGLDASRKPSIVQVRDLAFFFNGVDSFVYDGSGTRQIGITAPTAVATFDSLIAGELNSSGSYLVTYTYYNSNTGAESSPADPSAQIVVGSTASTQGIRVNVTAGDPSTADAIRIWRTVSGGSTFFLETTIGISDTSADIVLLDQGVGEQLELDNSRLPEVPKYAVVYDNRIFVAGFPSNPNRVMYSKIGQNGAMPESFQAADFTDCNLTDGDEIIGLGVANNMVIVQKNRSVGKLIRIDAQIGGLEEGGSNKYLYEQISNEVTSLSHFAGVEMDNIWVWLGKNEVFGTNGIDIYRFGKRRQKFLKTLNYSSTVTWKFHAINKSDSKQLIFTITTGSSTEPDVQMVGHYKDFSDTGELAWTTYAPGANTTTHPGLRASCLFNAVVNRETRYYFGNSNGNGLLYQFDVGTNDNGLGIEVDVRLPPEDAQDDSAKKLFKDYHLFAAGTRNVSYNITHRFYEELETSAQQSGTTDLLGSGLTAWASATWGNFTWSGVRFIPVSFHPHRRARWGQYGYFNNGVDEPIAVKSIISRVKLDPTDN